MDVRNTLEPKATRQATKPGTGRGRGGAGIEMQTTSSSSITSHLDLIKTSKQSSLETVERFLLLSLSEGAIRKLLEVSTSLSETSSKPGPHSQLILKIIKILKKEFANTCRQSCRMETQRRLRDQGPHCLTWCWPSTVTQLPVRFHNGARQCRLALPF